jgi:hypothetical protein
MKLKKILPFFLAIIAVVALMAGTMISTGQTLLKSAKSVIAFIAVMLLVLPFYFRRHDEL